MLRFSTLMGVFALLCAGYFVYQAQQAGALNALAPAAENTAEAEAITEAEAENTPAVTAEKSAAAETPDYGTFTCTPEAFTLTSTAAGYQLKGLLETPTPGFGYTPRYIKETPETADMVFELRGPQGMVAQVIGKMEIDHMYVRDGSMQTMTVRLDKTFAWGPDTIVCQNNTAPTTDTSTTETPAPDTAQESQEQQETPDASKTDAPVTE